MAFKHGITITEIDTGARTISAVATSVIGLVAIASDANATTFPLDKPVLITDLADAISKAGTNGTLASSLRAISSIVSTPVVVVRVEEGGDAAETASNVIGGDVAGEKTGMQALLAARAQTRAQPKILIAPGLETQAVTKALAVVAKKLRAFAYARVVGDTVAEAGLYRANFDERELMLITPDWLVWDTATSANVTGHAAAYAGAMRALIDQQYGPQKTLSNVPVPGVLGITKDFYWDIENMASDVGVLNQAHVTSLIRTDAGYRFWGNRTCAADTSLYKYESTVRVAQLLTDTIAQGMLWAVDKPLTPSLTRDIIETINGFFRQLKAQGVVLGANAWFDSTLNSVESLKAGKLRIDYDYTVPPPLEDLGFNQRITDKYLADFSAALSEA
ncbi:phage tail sheath protein FI [Sphingobium sp. B2D3B]|uniref:phage tail sheath C-terminal domain-containing protein n=1 Tax=Sphingobium sp. B2D3B TaxID=2940580 RepID=UPI0022259069|nr:phage tail sheath C-terminal domain-containing protein [Sphingobium sp. B2D3B]MCW2383359.1 phage tail sheath protein FI [Sphingobium sp. B2D3B]